MITVLSINTKQPSTKGLAQIQMEFRIIVPQDIQTRINELMRSMNDWSKYVRTEKVNTLSGSRVLEKMKVFFCSG